MYNFEMMEQIFLMVHRSSIFKTRIDLKISFIWRVRFEVIRKMVVDYKCKRQGSHLKKMYTLTSFKLKLRNKVSNTHCERLQPNIKYIYTDISQRRLAQKKNRRSIGHRHLVARNRLGACHRVWHRPSVVAGDRGSVVHVWSLWRRA